MFKRLGLGLIKGALIGAALGSFFHFGLGWVNAPGLLGYLLAMGTGATAGILSGKPPWRQHAWIESVLKAIAGIAIGALLYWIASSWLAFDVPAVLGLGEGVWVDKPLLSLFPVAVLFASLIELDNTDIDPPAQRSSRNKKKVRVSVSPEIVDAEVLPNEDTFVHGN